MAATGKITLDIKDYEAKLKQIDKLTVQTAGNSKRHFGESVGQLKNGISKAGTLVSALGSQIGSAFGAVGNVISAMTSGPVALLTAAAGLAIAGVVRLYDRLTLSDDEYAAKVEKNAQRVSEARQKTETQVKTDSGYMDRLQELAQREKLSNAEKAEAAALIKMLTERYGNLGISIDSVTGKLIGADAAQKKFTEAAKKQRIAALEQELAANQAKARNQAGMATKDSWDGSSQQKLRMNFVNEKFSRGSLQDQLAFAMSMEGSAKTKDKMKNWGDVVATLKKQIELRKELERLQKTGSTTEDEEVQKLKTKSEIESKTIETQKKREESFKSMSEELDNQIEKQKLLNVGKNDELARLDIINNAKLKGITLTEQEIQSLLKKKQILTEEQKITEAKNRSKRLRESQATNAESLYNKALRAIGRGKEADQNEALANARRTKGSDLTDTEKSMTLKLLELQKIIDTKNDIPRSSSQSIITNSLTARGGWAGGARLPSVNQHEQHIIAQITKIKEVLDEIKTLNDKLKSSFEKGETI